MASTSSIEMKAVNQQLPPVPVTIEGSSVLHQMFRFRWTEWRKLSKEQKQEIAGEAAILLEQLEQGEKAQSALYPCSVTKAICCWFTSANLLSSSKPWNCKSLICG